jgi:hypothetical protein
MHAGVRHLIRTDPRVVRTSARRSGLAGTRAGASRSIRSTCSGR